MSVTERSPRVRSSLQIPAPSETVLMAVIVAAFLLLHVFAGTLMQRPSTPLSAPPTEQGTPSSYD